MATIHPLGGATVLTSIIEALADAALVVGADNRLVCANAAARALLPGMREGEPISRALRAPEILDAIRMTRPGTPVDVIWLDRVPLERRYDVHVAALGSRVADAVLITLRDTTDVRRNERVRADFIANASHELRTPLASVIGFIETLQGPARDDPAAQARFLAIMGEQARRMSRLVDDLLSLSQIERSLHVHPTSEVDLASVASQIADALAPMAEDKNVVIQLNAATPVHVLGDRDELLRVVENLVENAIKYGGSGTVEIEVVQDAVHGMLTITDEGPGIAPQHMPRLTERFYRINSADSRAKGGTGLGLAIVKHIVARHRGRLSIHSAPGHGARFTVSLPRVDLEPRAAG